MFARIERWTNLADATDIFWRSISKDNITTWYGLDAASRIADPADSSRIFEWLISQSYDDKGNVISYVYKAEDSEGVDLTQANERNRTDASRSAKRYIKNIFYGNRTPLFSRSDRGGGNRTANGLVLRAGVRLRRARPAAPAPEEVQPWGCRLDPFSTYRPTFEVRTYRLCRRVLMFHNFPNEPNVGPIA